jgi:hypothetical protein
MWGEGTVDYDYDRSRWVATGNTSKRFWGKMTLTQTGCSESRTGGSCSKKTPCCGDPSMENGHTGTWNYEGEAVPPEFGQASQ